MQLHNINGFMNSFSKFLAALALWATSYTAIGQGVQACDKNTADQSTIKQCDDRFSNEIKRLSKSDDLTDGWKIVRTANPAGSGEAIDLMHTADTARSDLSLAGMSLRCIKTQIDVVLIVLEPLSRKGSLSVTLRTGSDKAEFSGSIMPTGQALVLPHAIDTLTKSGWINSNELSVTIATEKGPISGLIPIHGLPEAIKALPKGCQTN